MLQNFGDCHEDLKVGEGAGFSKYQLYQRIFPPLEVARCSKGDKGDVLHSTNTPVSLATFYELFVRHIFGGNEVTSSSKRRKCNCWVLQWNQPMLLLEDVWKPPYLRIGPGGVAYGEWTTTQIHSDQGF